MVFSSFTFLFAFLPITLVLYYLVPKRAKNYVLLIISLLFYGWGEPVYILLLLLSIGVNYLFGRTIDDANQYGEKRRAKFNMVFAIVWNLLVIGFFKYYGFLISGINHFIPGLIPQLTLPLPIGISFFTFQAMSYIFDVHREKVNAEKNFFVFAMYISMFPQVISGPIVRYSDIKAEIADRKLTLPEIGAGCEQFIRGLIKKLLLANSLGLLFTNIQGLKGDEVSVLALWLGAIAYTLQIYFDFSGYSDMAIGLARMLGFHYKANFNHPYIATSITDFWRRWHISLSMWFRDYVYIPLGGNRRGTLIQIRNIAVVWLLTGLWHGASWNFILWGGYYGVLLLLEKFVFQRFANSPIFGKVYRVFTIVAIVVGWMLFANTDLSMMTAYIKGMFGLSHIAFWGASFLYYLKQNLIIIIIGIICATPVIKGIRSRLMRGHAYITAAINVVMLMLCVAALVFQSYSPFLYFRF